MNKKVLLASGLIALTMIVSACGGGATKPADTAKNTPAASSTAKPGAKPGAKPAPPKEATKVLKPGEKPPAAATKGIPEGKKVAVPDNWQTVYDADRGYEFQVPENTLSDWKTLDNGTDVYIASFPEPAKISTIVVAYKDSTEDKDGLVKQAKAFLEALGEKDVKISDTKEDLNDDYFLVQFTSKDDKGVATQGKILFAVDKTDNFMMVIASPEADFKANEKIMDEAWSSFAMYSGGLSGNSATQ